MLSHDSVLAYFFLMGAFTLLGLAFLRPGSFYQTLLHNEKATHYEGIDGLRGLLAFGVFFLHTQVNLYYHQTGEVAPPPSAFYRTLGEFAVGLFFIITAFLFWSKVLRAEGRINLIRLYQGRNRRLTPMYLVSVVLVLLVVAYRTDFELQVPPEDLLVQLFHWFSYGLFAIPQLPDINGLEATHSIQGVYWTLTFEWEFYLLLPLLAILPYRTVSLCLVMLFFAFLTPFPPIVLIVLNFALGAVAAWLMHNYELQKHLRGPAFDVAMILTLALVLFLFSTGQGIPQYLLGFVFFMLLVCGNTMFGLLTARPVKFIGVISYSIYLLHNIIIAVVFYHLYESQDPHTISPLLFWVVSAVCGVLVILASALTYRFVEHPFMAGQVSSVGSKAQKV